MMQAIRVAQVVPSDLRPYRVGFYNALSEVSELDVKVYAGQAASVTGSPERPPEIQLPVHRLRTVYWPRSLKAAWHRGTFSVLRSPVDVIVIPELIHNLSVWTIRLLARPYGKKLVIHGVFFRHPRNTFFDRVTTGLRRYLRRTADALATYSQRGADALIAEGVDDDRVFVCPNTIDTVAIRAIAEREGDHRQAGTFRVVFLGRLLEPKRLDVLIDAIRLLPRDAVRLVVIGDGPERVDLERRAAGIDVEWLGMTYDEEAIARIFARVDVLVVPGRVGLTCVQGFASGLPIVTAARDALDQSAEFDYIRHGVNGVIVDSLDPRCFADALNELRSDHSKLESMRAAARATASDLGMDQMVQGFVSAVRRAVGAEGVGGSREPRGY